MLTKKERKKKDDSKKIYRKDSIFKERKNEGKNIYVKNKWIKFMLKLFKKVLRSKIAKVRRKKMKDKSFRIVIKLSELK